METQEKLLGEVLQPDMEFTPIPFWFFNDAFDEEKVRNQLTDYVEKGVNGLVLHPRIGVPKEMPYLSEEYFRAVRFIVKTAAELKMKVVLYDEGMYPSGSAHGMVVKANPEYASKGIIILDADKAQEKLAAEETAQVIAEFSDGRKLIYGFAGGTIRGIHFGEDDGQPGAPKAADILNPDAVDEFIRLTHDRYYEELKEYFGTTVIAFFTDEPSALGRGAGRYRAWVKGMEKELEAAGGKVEELEALFVKTGKAVAGRSDIVETKENVTVRLYRQMIKRKLREIFYARLSGWCENHGISLIGHPAESNDIEEELYFHIPGQDLIMRRVAPETGGLREFDSVQAKLSADIARHLGRRRNANECFGVCYRDKIPWYMTAGDMKWYIDWLGLRGVNLFIPHAFYYSVEGERKGERPPDVGPNNIWWKHYRRFSDYMKRLSWIMTDSVNSAETAVLCDNNNAPYEEIACLYENQVEFNYLPAALLEQAEVSDAKVRIEGYAYTKVLNVLGQRYTDRFADKLGDILVSGTDDLLSSEIRLEQPCPTLRKIHLRKQGAELYLFGNEGSEPICTRITIPGMKDPGFVDLWRGEAYAVENAGESFCLNLQPSETLLVIKDGAGFCGKCRAEDWYKAEYPDWTERFEQTVRNGNSAEYVIKFLAKEAAEPVRFSVRAEEMVECFCNGQFVDVSFWGEHRFELTEFIRKDINEIRLVVTGNAANIYENAGIAFGLMK